MTKNIRLDDDVYGKLKQIQDKYNLTLSEVLDFLIESKVNMKFDKPAMVTA
jgi:predicted CopG family antitoxin